MASVKIKPHSGLRLDVKLPGDKSISHRAAMLAALSEGTAVLTDFSTGADCASTLACLAQLGTAIESGSAGVSITGNGLRGLEKPMRALDCGNSGTTARLLAGILAGQHFDATLIGDASLSGRPMGRILDPLTKMGGRLTSDHEHLPLEISARNLKAIDYTLTVPSAQVKSCVLLAGLFAEGETIVRESIPSRDHTERMLSAVRKQYGNGAARLSVTGGQRVAFGGMTIPGDFSSAAFLIAAGLLVPRSEVRIRGVGLNPTRTGFLEVLGRMGASVRLENSTYEAGEPYGDVIVKTHSRKFRDVSIKGAIVPSVIDELPVLAVLGTRCENGMEVRDAGELRFKECDRIEAIAENLRAMDIRVDTFDDGFFIHPSPLASAHVSSRGDHRIAMAMAVAGLVAGNETVIEDAECIRISFPEFFEYLAIETDAYALEMN